MCKLAAAGDFRCANVGCKVAGRDLINQQCAQCRRVWYCGRACQRTQRTGGPAAVTRRTPKLKSGATAPTAPASPAGPAASAGPAAAAAAAPRADGDDDPEHPCPICLVNEDDQGRCGLCFECAQ